MTDMHLRAPLRPLGRILSARAKGEDTIQIERDNINKRHENEKEQNRIHAQGRLLVLGVVYILQLP